MNKITDGLSFEEAIAKLENITKRLEESIPLEESIALFRDGYELVCFCNEKLQNAEKQVKILSENADMSVSEKDYGEMDYDA